MMQTPSKAAPRTDEACGAFPGSASMLSAVDRSPTYVIDPMTSERDR